MRPGRRGRAWALTFSSARVSALMSVPARWREKCYMERLLPIGTRNGMEILGPPGPPPDH
jgi:hypothetical protein